MFLKLMIDNHQKHIALNHSLFWELENISYQRIVGFSKTIHSNKYQVQNALLVLQKSHHLSTLKIIVPLRIQQVQNMILQHIFSSSIIYFM
jgi:hypothetical protein